jgi:putative glutamine amidotransferase
VAVVAPLSVPRAEPVITRLVQELATSALGLVDRAGADPWLVDVSRPDRPDPTGLVAAQGVLLLGGGDVDPALYGVTEPVPELYGVDRSTDEHSIAVVRCAVEAGRPLLGICRGAQVLNVALGGTLVPHLDGDVHRDPGGGDLFRDELVDLDPASWAGRVLGRAQVKVRSGHHQAVAVPGSGLRAAGWAVDGVIESIEHEATWAVGLQWHPEEVDGDGEDADRLFRGFIDVVRG